MGPSKNPLFVCSMECGPEQSQSTTLLACVATKCFTRLTNPGKNFLKLSRVVHNLNSQNISKTKRFLNDILKSKSFTNNLECSI